MLQRSACRCGWRGPMSIDKLFGSNVHPDVLKKQLLQGSKESYAKSGESLNAESVLLIITCK